MSILDVTRVERITPQSPVWEETVKKLYETDHCFLPEYVVLVNGEVCGAFASMPYVSWWMDEKKSLKFAHSLVAFNTLDNLMGLEGFSEYVIPCSEDSPYSALMPKIFKSIGSSEIFLRQLPGK